MAVIRRMVDELYARAVISEPEVKIIVLEAYVPNIWFILNMVDDTREETHKDKNEIRKDKV